MDPDLTGNGFRSFVGRRGIVRNAVPEEIAGRSAIPNGSRHGVPPPGGRVRSTGGAAGAVSRNSTAHTSLGASQAPVVGAATGTAPAQDSSRRQYFCEICNLPFGRKHHKERHVANIHRQERPYVCSICGFAFHQKPNLDRHRATVHHETRPFKCRLCDKRFSRRRELSTHEQMEHDGSQRHNCVHCAARFTSTRDLHAHLRHVHLDQFNRSSHGASSRR